MRQCGFLIINVLAAMLLALIPFPTEAQMTVGSGHGSAHGDSKKAAMTVRRHIIWNNLRPDLKEDLAHLVQDIRGVFAVLQAPVLHRFQFDPFSLF